MPNNFPKAIPDFKQSMKTISMFKDEYLLDFINTENLGLEIEDIDERVVEQEIVRNMRDFILQFGKDFIFMGNQYRVVLFILLYTAITAIQMLKSDRIGRKSK